MNDSSPPFDPDRMYHAVIEAGETWADAKSAYALLDDQSKTILADLMGSNDELSVSERERAARSSEKWKEHVLEKGIARKRWLLSEVRYQGLCSLAEWRRSQESSRRTEMSLIRSGAVG